MKLRITVQGQTYEVDVELVDSTLASGSAAPAAGVVAPPRPPAAIGAAALADKIIRAPIPGNIVAIKVLPGQTVHPGDPIVVLEAMKMETPLSVTAIAKVKAVLVDVGAVVKQGQALVEFE